MRSSRKEVSYGVLCFETKGTQDNLVYTDLEMEPLLFWVGGLRSPQYSRTPMFLVVCMGVLLLPQLKGSNVRVR